MRPEILAEIPTGVYAFVGAMILGNISLISMAIGVLFKHFLSHNRMIDEIARLNLSHSEMKKSLDTVWDRVRGISKSQ